MGAAIVQHASTSDSKFLSVRPAGNLSFAGYNEFEVDIFLPRQKKLLLPPTANLGPACLPPMRTS